MKPAGADEHDEHLEENDGLEQAHDAEQAASRPRRRRIPRWVWWVTATAVALVVAFLIVLAYIARNAEPILKRRVIANLQQRFHTSVELDELHISVFKGLEVSGSGLRIGAFTGERPNGTAPGAFPPDILSARLNAAPMIAVRSFSFRTGVRQLMEPSMRIDMVRVEGLRLRIPPKQQGPRRPVRRPGRSRARPAGEEGWRGSSPDPNPPSGRSWSTQSSAAT